MRRLTQTASALWQMSPAQALARKEFHDDRSGTVTWREPLRAARAHQLRDGRGCPGKPRDGVTGVRGGPQARGGEPRRGHRRRPRR